MSAVVALARLSADAVAALPRQPTPPPLLSTDAIRQLDLDNVALAAKLAASYEEVARLKAALKANSGEAPPAPQRWLGAGLPLTSRAERPVLSSPVSQVYHAWLGGAAVFTQFALCSFSASTITFRADTPPCAFAGEF